MVEKNPRSIAILFLDQIHANVFQARFSTAIITERCNYVPYFSLLYLIKLLNDIKLVIIIIK